MGSRIKDGKEIKEHTKEILSGKFTLEGSKEFKKRTVEVLSGKSIVDEEKVKISLSPTAEIHSGKRINETAENPEISSESKFLRTQNPQIKSGKTIGQLRSSEKRLFVVDLETGRYGNVIARILSQGSIILPVSEFDNLTLGPPLLRKGCKIKFFGKNVDCSEYPFSSGAEIPSGFVPVYSLGQKILMKLNPIAVARRVWRSIYHPKIFAGRWVMVRGVHAGRKYKVRARIVSVAPHGLDLIIGASTVEYV